MTLYTYSSDIQNNGASACYSSCATNWPPFYTDTLSLPSQLNPSDFSVIQRTDGSKQITYKGYPLYLFIGDQKAGDVNGNNVGGFIVATK